MARIQPLLVLLVAGLVVIVAGCSGTTPIKTLLDDPSRYDHKIVRITGTVVTSIGALGYGGYEVDDGTGRLTVVTSTNGAPREGAKVGVEGEFRAAFTLGATSLAAVVEKKRFTP